MRRWLPTKLDALRAIDRAPGPYSAYIADQIVVDRFGQRWPTGGRPSAETVRRRLKALAADGYVERSAAPAGNYGFGWTLTAKGRRALAGGEVL